MSTLLVFHQGWTDIINCLPMINWYAKKNTRLFVLFRDDAKALTGFYLRGLRNVFPIYIPKDLFGGNWGEPVDFKHHGIMHLELIGHFDVQRMPHDPYRDAYHRLNLITDYPFEKLFYEAYDIPYIERINSFVLYRDPVAEEAYYTKYVKREPYICVHAVDVKPDEDMDVIQLGESSETFFDAIRVLQHAKAIHVRDSVWAGVCYMLDAKYGMFQTVPIYVYCERDFYRMFTQPVTLPNWTIVTPNPV